MLTGSAPQNCSWARETPSPAASSRSPEPAMIQGEASRRAQVLQHPTNQQITAEFLQREREPIRAAAKLHSTRDPKNTRRRVRIPAFPTSCCLRIRTRSDRIAAGCWNAACSRQPAPKISPIKTRSPVRREDRSAFASAVIGPASSWQSRAVKSSDILSSTWVAMVNNGINLVGVVKYLPPHSAECRCCPERIARC